MKKGKEEEEKGLCEKNFKNHIDSQFKYRVTNLSIGALMTDTTLICPLGDSFYRYPFSESIVQPTS